MPLPLKFLAMMLAMVAPAAACHAQPAIGERDAPLERMISLKDVRGRIDHLAIDLQHRRLFVAEL